MKMKAPTIGDIQNKLQNSCMCDSENVESSKLVYVDHSISSRPRFKTKALESLLIPILLSKHTIYD